VKVRVCNDLAFVRPDSQPTETESGIQLVYDRQRSTMRGTVVALGDGPVTKKGVRLPHCVKVGDRVIFSPDAGAELSFEKETIVCLREEEILAIIQE
jgi:chaperonin GroES